MSTFDGYVSEFPLIRIDQFATLPNRPAPLACFLSHIHSDHLRGLLSLKSPFVYCTHATRQLLLRLEKYPHRLNFARGVLEARVQTYRHLKKLLRPLPLGCPTQIELRPGEVVCVTALDANHCPGSCMFLIQGGGKNVLYTGDVRCEKWFVDRLLREPVMAPFMSGLTALDCVYLDTSFASMRAAHARFPSKAEGIKELLKKVNEYSPDTLFYLNTWTFGYEEVWIALANHLDTKVHLDDYRWRLYRSLEEGDGQDISISAPLVGFQEGNRWQPGCLTREYGKDVRIHSCEHGIDCEIFKNQPGVGGGFGDLNQIHEIELNDLSILGRLADLCTTRLQEQPAALANVTKWLSDSVKQGAQNIRVDTETFYRALHGDGDNINELEEVPIDRLISAIETLLSKKTAPRTVQQKRITFPYSRHASFEELRLLIGALHPETVLPNTYEPGMDMDALFGDLVGKCGASASTSPRVSPATSQVLKQSPIEGMLTTTPDPLASPLAITREREQARNASKRSAPDVEIRQEVLQRRRKAYKAALGCENGEWASVELVSVSGYHNEPAEVEL
ncbi:hypothetical protein ANO11243_010830 [Dothideomycetidae sp. 11243]|nr:hypothetical protein ANO11243_010830 [fungal sp. No.11243]